MKCSKLAQSGCRFVLAGVVTDYFFRSGRTLRGQNEPLLRGWQIVAHSAESRISPRSSPFLSYWFYGFASEPIAWRIRAWRLLRVFRCRLRRLFARGGVSSFLQR